MGIIRTILIVILTLPFVAQAQSGYRPVEQKTTFQKNVQFRDSVRMQFLEGSGSFVKINEFGWLVRGSSVGGGGTIPMDSVTNLIATLATKQDLIIAGDSLFFDGDTLKFTGISLQDVTNWQDTAATLQRKLIAGEAITISGDTISASADSYWFKTGNTIYNVGDSVSIGASSSNYKFQVIGTTNIKRLTGDTTLFLQGNILSGTGGIALAITRNGGEALNIDGIGINAIDTVLNPNITDKKTLITHYAARGMIRGFKNVGGFEQLYVQNVDDTAQFKTLRAGTGITITDNSTSLLIEAPSANGDTLINVGGGAGLAISKTSDSLRVKTLIAGSNITLTPTDTTIVIASTGGGSGVVDTAINVGGGAGVFKEKSVTGDSLVFKSIVQGIGGVVVTNNADDITIGLTGWPVFTTTNQTVNGIKTFTNNVLLNGTGNVFASGSTMNLRTTDSNSTTLGAFGTARLIVVPNGNIGIRNTNPSQALDVNGQILSRDTLRIGGTLGNYRFTTSAGSTNQILKLTSGGVLNWATDENTTYSAGTGLTLGGTTFALTGQALAFHNLSGNGIVVKTGSGTAASRTITGGTGINVTNGNGVSGNPTITLNAGLDNLTDVVITSPTTNQSLIYNGTNWVNSSPIAKTQSQTFYNTANITLSESDTTSYYNVIRAQNNAGTIFNFSTAGCYIISGKVLAEVDNTLFPTGGAPVTITAAVITSNTAYTEAEAVSGTIIRTSVAEETRSVVRDGSGNIFDYTHKMTLPIAPVKVCFEGSPNYVYLTVKMKGLTSTRIVADGASLIVTETSNYNSANEMLNQ